MQKKVIIFGAYGALGQGVTKTLLEKGYDKFYLFDINAENNKPVDKRITVSNNGDLSNEDNVKNAFSKIEVSAGDRFFLFSTVGGFIGGPEVIETNAEDFDKMFNMNTKSNFLIGKYYSLLASRGGGAACFTTAYSGFSPEAGRAAYGASKSALNYIIKCLSEEGLSKKISITGIAPFVLDTSANREWMQTSELEKAQKPEEIGELVHFIFENYHYLSGNILQLKHRFGI